MVRVLSRMVVAAVGVGVVAAGLIAAGPAQGAPNAWKGLLSYSNQGLHEISVSGNKVTKIRRVAGEDRWLEAASGQYYVSNEPDVGDLGPKVYKIGRRAPVAEFYTFTGQRTLPAPARGKVIVMQTDPNGESAYAYIKDIAFGDETPVATFDLLDEATGIYEWVEKDVSVPVRSGAAYFGSQVYLPRNGGPDKDRGVGFRIYRVDVNGNASVLTTIDTLNYGRYVTGFCVSPKGTRVAFTNFIDGGSAFQKQLTVLDLPSGRTWVTQTSGMLGGSCFVDENTFVVADDDLIVHNISGGTIKRSKIRVPASVGGATHLEILSTGK